jgi:eukaryotic-like serine/threonine-protein kinase
MGGGRDEWKGTDRYEVLSCLGHGGMGVVYEVFDRERRQLVALKTLLHFNPAALYLFKQEFRTLADVQHANLVHLYELVVGDVGDTFFTMELVRGTDFLRYVRKPEVPKGSNPPATIVSVKPLAVDRETVRPRGPEGSKRPIAISAGSRAIMSRLRAALRQLVEGVHVLHSAGKLHRDIKPSNVLVTPEGRVVLLDFGVATELSSRAGDVAGGSGEVVGTARYMAPEQAYDEPPTPASDWYSVGVMLYESLVGRPPFVGSAADVITMKGLMEAPSPSESVEGVPAELEALCRSLLDRDPAKRPTGSEILRRLGVTRSGGLTSSPAAAVDSATALIGREEQLRLLRAAFDATREGRMITVRVGGGSGMGKSTVVHHILDELVRGDEALVLRGRAYERETVPYKAIDSVVDALSRHLLRLAEADDALPLPNDIGALGRLFPVLQRVPGIRERLGQPSDELPSLRRRAFGALRDLLTELAKRQPLVVFIDDAQWGDVDSAVLLLDLLRSETPPPLLLVMTYRDNEAESSPFLGELRERWPETAEARDVPVGPLDAEDARRLALTLLDASDAIAQRTARAVARESRGSPFLIEELVRTNRGTSSNVGATLAVLTLEQMVGERLARLPDEARRLLEIVAVGGCPLPVSIVAEASGLQDSVNEVIAFVSARRFVRIGLRDGRDVVETTHDRFRETIVAQLPGTTLREHHSRLARVLEQAPGADAEAIAMHCLGAGDKERAARFAEVAADQAAANLAFDQAARLFRVTLENLATSSPNQRRLRVRLARTLELGGRAIESARVYLQAADGATATEQVEYRRAAAEQLLNAGRIDEGAEILHRVLAAVGMSAPRSPLSAFFWLVVYRIWISLIGLRFKERDPEQVSDADRLCVDALFTVATGFGLVNLILGACMQARHFVEALRKGDRFQVLRAVSLEVAQAAATGKPESRREKALVALGRNLAKNVKESDGQVLFDGMHGLGCYMRGLWKEAQAGLERVETAAANRAYRTQRRLFLARTQYYLGRMKEAMKLEAPLYAEAEDRGDLYMTVNMRTSTFIRKWLAEDDPIRARRDVREALAQWSQKGFFIQHWQAMVFEPDIDLYVGDGGSAYERFSRDRPALKRSLMLTGGLVRVLTLYTQARVAIASIASDPSLRSARIAEARAAAHALRKESSPWSAMLAAMVDALVENASAHREPAIAALREADRRAEQTDSLCYVAPIRFRLGELLGGEEGRALVQDATETIKAEGVHNPARWVAFYLPGTWGAAPVAVGPRTNAAGTLAVAR